MFPLLKGKHRFEGDYVNTYPNDNAAVPEWSIRALALMAEHQIAPVPMNYELWFRYVSGQDEALNKEIDKHLEQKNINTAETLNNLYRHHLGKNTLAETALEAGDKLNSELDKILRLVQSTVGDNSALGSSVREASAGLTSKSSPSDIGRVVEAIMGASLKMEQHSKELEERLNESKSELESLQTNLKNARSEARTDGLTGVNNRKAFDEMLEEKIRRAQSEHSSLCLVMGDIDHFKSFNDTWGHRTGDQVLKLVASCLKNGARDADFVARYGGEEFAVIMPEASLQGAGELANRIREAVQARELMKRSTGESLGRVTMSMGISTFRPGDNSASLIERADANLYNAKKAGRNRVVLEGDAEADAPLAKAG